MKRKSIMIFCLIVILFLGFWLFGKKNNKGGFVPPKSVVTVVEVNAETMPTLIRQLGTLQAIDKADIAPEISGTIEEIAYEEGSFVKAGDLLIKLVSNTQQAKLEQAKAQANLAKLSYERNKNLFERKAQSQQEFDKAEADYKVAEAAVTLAQADLDKMSIRAPFDGRIGSRNYSVGQYVTEGTQLVTIVDKSKLRINYAVPQRYLDQLRLGAKVVFDTPAFPLEAFIGHVDFISPTVDVTTRTIPLEAVFENPNERLSPGLSGTVIQTLRVNENALVIPEETLVPTITGYQVYKVVDETVQTAPVEIGSRYQGKVHILTGIEAGDVIVAQGHQNLRDGAPVEILEQDS